MRIEVDKYIPHLTLAAAICLGLALAHLATTVLQGRLQQLATTRPAATGRQASERPAPPPDTGSILQRNLFHARVSKAMAGTANAQTPALTLGDLKLLGTVAGSAPFAMVQTGGELQAVRPGEKLPGIGTVQRIERNLLELKMNDGRLARLEPEGGSKGGGAPKTRTPVAPAQRKRTGSNQTSSAGITQLGPNRWLIARSEADKARANIGTLLQQARMVPHVVAGKTEGFAVVRPGPLLGKLGILRGDIIAQVNEISLDSPQKAMEVFTQLQEAKNISINLLRNQQPITLEYEVR